MYSIIDTHMDSFVSGNQYAPRDFGKKTNIGHVDYYRLKEGNVSAGFFAVYPAHSDYLLNWGTNAWFEILENYPEYFCQIKKFNDLKKVQSSEKVGAILHFEGSGGIDSEFNNLKNFYRIGLRSMGITWSNMNRFGTGVGTNKDRGLTAEGKELVQEMNRLGIIVDVSHLNEKSFWDVIEVSNKPVIASHSNAWEICNHKRNLKDDQIEAIKESGGTIGLNLCISFLKEKVEKPEKIGFKHIIKHINYIVKKAGIDHLTLGSDFDGARVPEVIKDVSYYPNLIRILEGEGYSSEDIEKITHKNIERVIKKVWK
ncbi:MAG: dipeptidase [Candidatus Heimdallarchaeum aukensis]|uniref:Dipeptidase n=1 Tax=Candidatus Heimdallarchaeum aukensis TaxID=2876573 RepID=A0A9Y1FL82_9ARCH|nr:MAG: dipeptidase [Candidatus Heimdallarchaeum aukensis]